MESKKRELNPQFKNIFKQLPLTPSIRNIMTKAKRTTRSSTAGKSKSHAKTKAKRESTVSDDSDVSDAAERRRSSSSDSSQPHVEKRRSMEMIKFGKPSRYFNTDNRRVYGLSLRRNR
jgi:hypothetical protein